MPNTKPPRTSQTVGRAIEQQLRQIGIPPCPEILVTIREEMAKDEPAYAQLAKLIGEDVSLAATLIKTANSPMVGLRSRARSVFDAIMVLGLQLTSSTIAGLLLQKMFDHIPSLNRFWGFSAELAHTNGWLARRVGDIPPGDAYTFGLFRDCGIPVLMAPFAQEYAVVLQTANQEETKSFTEIEDAALGLNHAAVGADLTETWLLPAEISGGIRHHHNLDVLDADFPLHPLAKDLVTLSHIAEFLIQRQTGLSKTQEWQKFGATCLGYFGFSELDFDWVSKEYQALGRDA